MKKFINEFKEFINRGSVMDMAIGIIIGGAFTTIVKSLTDDIINPFITLLCGSSAGVPVLVIPVEGTKNGIDFSAFISACINFLIIALVVFSLMKAINGLQAASKKALAAKLLKEEQEKEAAPAHPSCPFCLEEVKEGATRCPHCAGDIASVETE